MEPAKITKIHGFTLTDEVSEGKYLIRRVKGGMSYMLDTRGLNIRELYHTNYTLVSPAEFSMRADFMTGTQRAYDLFKQGINLAGHDDFKALNAIEESHQILSDLTSKDSILARLLRLDLSIIANEIKLCAGYFHVQNQVASPQFYQSKLEALAGHDLQAKLKLFINAENEMAIIGGQRILVA
ncbi:MAG: hypothetical protein AABX11_07405 [Nanoarchaeota archaeon]